MKTFAEDAAAIAQSWNDFASQMARQFANEDVIEFRCLGGGKPVHRWATVAELDGLHDELTALNDANYNVYYGMNPRRSVGGTTEADVEFARCLAIDIDGGTTPEQLVEATTAAGLPTPTIVLATGGGSQALWRLREPLPIAEWRSRQRGIIAAVPGADACIHDAPRIMRAAGFRNRKPKRGPDFPMVRIAQFNAGTHDATDFPEGPPAYTQPVDVAGQPVSNIDTGGLLPKFVTAFLESGELLQPDGSAQPSRRETAHRVAIELAAAGVSIDDAREQIRPVLEQLGLDEADVADVCGRQIGNAYGKPRTPTVDADRLPKAIARPLPAEPEVVITDAGGGKHRVVCRRGLKTHIDTIDLGKQSARTRFLKNCGEALGEGTDVAFVDARLKAVAVGDEEAEAPEGQSQDFIPVDDFIRPERFAVTVGDDHTSGTTVPKFRNGPEGIEGVWMTHLAHGDGSRECVELPVCVEVGGKAFYMNPTIGPPAITRHLGWSASGQDSWLTTGNCVLPPAEMFAELRNTFGRFIDFTEDLADGTLNTLALWTVLTYTPGMFPVVPFMVFNGPKGSGKTQVLNCLKNVCFRVVAVANPSAASLYRELHINGGTTLVDEAEQLESADAEPGLMTALLHSNQRGATVPRCEGENFTPVHFSVFGAKAFFSIRAPHDPLADRAISIPMLRSPPGSPKAFMHPDAGKFVGEWQHLRDALFAFVMNHGRQLADLADAEDLTPADMFPRSRQTWGPLLQLANLFESLGVAGLLTNMQAFALERSARAEAATIDEVDEHVLRAFVSLRADSKETTSGAVQAKAFLLGLDPNIRLTAKAAGRLLARYGIRQGVGREKRVWVATDAHIRQVADRYGIQLDLKNDTGTPLEDPPHPPHPPREPHEPTESGGGRGGGGGRGESSGGVSGNVSGKVVL